MGISFSSSLFGLAGSLILGFLDLQSSQAQNRFYTELENWLSSVTDLDSERPQVSDATAAVASDDIRLLVAEIQKLANRDGNDRSVAAIAGLAEGIQGLVKNMRNEQQMLRDWIEAQQEDARAMRKTLERLNDKIGGAK